MFFGATSKACRLWRIKKYTAFNGRNCYATNLNAISKSNVKFVWVQKRSLTKSCED